MTWRKLDNRERAFLDTLLSPDFPGCDALRRQLQGAEVEEIDDQGCLRFKVAGGRRASVLHRVPVEAESRDQDGVGLHMLHHVIDGELAELEIFREDGVAVLALPPPEKWEVR